MTPSASRLLLRPLFLLVALGLLGSGTSHAAAFQQPNAARLQLQLARLGVVGRVLYIAAHPDDENTGLLAYLANARKLEVAYLSLTRGDGGQNLIGSEQASKLGIIRTQELLQARRLDGAIQFFTRAKDFGYSKSSAETLRFWGRKQILADVVRVLRSFRPDVVITRFPEKGRTHGHHLASAQLARAAVKAAADPTQFPNQKLKPWKPRRLVHNVSTWMLRRRGWLKRKDILARYMRLDIGGYSPLLGRSYGEVSAASRSMHKSQGFGRAARRGPIYEYFQHLVGAKASRDLLDGVALDWKRFAKGAAVARHITAAQRSFRPDQPHKAVPHLLAALKALAALPKAPRIEAKRQAIVQVIQGCLGLYLDARARTPFALPGRPLALSLRAISRAPVSLKLRAVQVVGSGLQGVSTLALKGTSLVQHKPWRRGITARLKADAQVSAPSWLRRKGRFGTYHIPDPAQVARPEDPAPLRVQFEVAIDQQTLTFVRPVRYVWTDRVRGEQARRVEVMPPLTATPELDVKLFPQPTKASQGAAKGQRLSFQVQAYAPGTTGMLRLRLPAGWKATPATIRLRFAKADEVQRHTFTVTPPAGATKAVHAVPELLSSGRTYSWKVHFLRYAHIPHITILEPARIKLVPLVLKPFVGKVGYIPGPGDFVAASLRQVGVDVQTIDDKTLRSGSLAGFRTIMTGIRAFNANQTLRQHRQRLMDWVAAGGTLLVQYNTNSSWRPLKVAVGPYPLTIGRSRVTDETAPITPLQPRHPLLQTPHKLTPRDYLGWIQERGLYFGVRWDRRYTPIFQMADPGSRPTRGSLLVAAHGKGVYVYTGISFFRQLPAGVPGAYRLLFNLLSLKQRQLTKAVTPKTTSQPTR